MTPFVKVAIAFIVLVLAATNAYMVKPWAPWWSSMIALAVVLFVLFGLEDRRG